VSSSRKASQKKGTVSPQQRTIIMCKHLRVQIVSRDEDAEYVECKDCGEVFDSSEFKDMAIEERTASSDEGE
jgi:transcription initiation factor TFIIIB Brf1 subunit/transcription initiation factor TFIIB